MGRVRAFLWRNHWSFPIGLALAMLFVVRVGFAGAADPEPALTTARQVRLLAPDQAARELPVSLEAVIIFIDGSTTVFIQDATAGTFFRDFPIEPRWKPGQRVRVEGKTYPGLYVPGIRASQVQTLQATEMPEPVKVTFDDLASGKYHYQWVEIEGIGRAVGVTGENGSSLHLAVGSRGLEARIDELPVPGLALVDAPLRVRGLAAGGINDRRQLVEPYLRVRSYADIATRSPPLSDSLPVIPAAHLLRFHPEGATGHRVKVQGTVLAHNPGEMLFLRDDEHAVLVQSRQGERLEPGERVEVVGFPQMGTFRAVLADAEFRRLGQASEPSPRTPSLGELNTGKYDADLVTVAGRLISTSSMADGDLFLLEADGNTFRVRGTAPAPTWPVGSRLSVTGIYRVTGGSSAGKGFSQRPVSFEVWARSMDDFRLLASPSWWTAERLIVALIGLAVLTLGTFGWVAWLRRRVRVQTGIIHDQLAQQVIMEERQRIAREVHDSLEQELVGLALRLDAAAAVAEPAFQSTLDTTRRLVGRIQSEVRDLVWDLRESANGPRDLAASLARLTKATEVPCRVDVTGSPWPLEGILEHNILRIAQEALTNAMKHAGPATVVIDMAYTPDKLHLRIRDDGPGFDPVSQGDKIGHFGLIGMRERARKMGASLQINSSPGQGTVIEVVVPRSAAQEGGNHGKTDPRADR